jgi:hypothetical protein
MQSYWDTPEGLNEQFVGAVSANDVLRAFDLLQSVDMKSQTGETALLIAEQQAVSQNIIHRT